jgi:hypothetical protein
MAGIDKGTSIRATYRRKGGPMLRRTNLIVMACLAVAGVAAAQDANITQPIAALEKQLAADPLQIVDAEISRPKAKGDITLKADISFGAAPPLRVKLRKAEPGADTFNNVPRYDLAAYELQKLFLDPPEYVVPPTVLRMLPRALFAMYSPDVEPTFPKADQVLGVIQYWLNNTLVIEDVYDAARFAADPLYARHIGQLNILTFLIEHRDSNAGNFLIGKAEKGARVFSIDNGVAFASEDSDRGHLWLGMRVSQLPADAIERLRRITPQVLEQKLGVVAQWQLQQQGYVPAAKSANLSAHRGVRLKGDQLQMGLTRSEIKQLQRQLKELLKRIDGGRISAAPVPAR